MWTSVIAHRSLAWHSLRTAQTLCPSSKPISSRHLSWRCPPNEPTGSLDPEPLSVPHHALSAVGLFFATSCPLGSGPLSTVSTRQRHDSWVPSYTVRHTTLCTPLAPLRDLGCARTYLAAASIAARHRHHHSPAVHTMLAKLMDAWLMVRLADCSHGPMPLVLMLAATIHQSNAAGPRLTCKSHALPVSLMP
mmetsp:Transcript_13236/g.26593  ORF Transcript_13236/g.26593 Transcript_13236/m.26593 type:complete len:192 (+) Transcript_13236:131-706(+)